MKIIDNTTHIRSIRARLDMAQLETLGIKAVAEAAGITLDPSRTSSRAYISSADSSTGIKHELVVEIGIDLTKEEQPK